MENETKPRTSPRDFFMNLGATALLYTGVINLLNLIFAIINKALPDAAEYYSFASASQTMRWAVATLIITYPLYVFFEKKLSENIALDPEKKSTGGRKWLTYLTLFIAGATIIINLVIVLNAFLGGELTTKFLLKTFAVLTVLLLVFEYYLLNLKDKSGYNKRIFATATALLILSVVWGFYEMGSPATQRMMRFDETRISDLGNIQNQLVNYWQRKGALPEKLGELSDNISGFTAPNDPDSKKEYEYNKTGKTSFSLCADFGLEQKSEPAYATSIPAITSAKYGFKSESWKHDAGHYCFERTIDTELYPVKNKEE